MVSVLYILAIQSRLLLIPVERHQFQKKVVTNLHFECGILRCDVDCLTKCNFESKRDMGHMGPGLSKAKQAMYCHVRSPPIHEPLAEQLRKIQNFQGKKNVFNSTERLND